ncbi:MAG: DUF2207 domain-containing protein [Pseudomonadota bacterium]
MRALLFAAAFFLVQAGSAVAEERITSFYSDVLVNTDGSLDVTETIEVTSEGLQIKRGILRNFPTRYKDAHGLDMQVGFSVTGVKRDGNEEPYSIENIQRGKSIRIGDKDVYLNYGKHVYEITYRTTRQIGFFENYDELYWNVTGNSWTFPIDSARVRVVLPNGAKVTQYSGYTGAFGTTGKNFKITQTEGGIFSARTTGPMESYQGFTVAVAWPKGFVTPPSESTRTFWALRDNATIFCLVLGLFGVMGYYFYAWNRVGRDPLGKEIIPLFHPPKNLGPAGTRFVWKQAYDDRTLATALVGLATQGWAKIGEDGDGEFWFDPQKRFGEVETAPERAAYAVIGPAKLWLKKENRSKVVEIEVALNESLNKSYHGVMFNRNRMWFWVGAALSIAVMLISALFLPDGERETAVFFSAFASVFASIVLGMMWKQLKLFTQSRGFWKKFGAIASLIVFVPFTFSFVVPAFLAVESGEASFPLVCFFGGGVLLALCNVVFLNLLYAPTQAGRWVIDEIEGFRMYLSTAEEDRLNVLHPPEKTPELFQRYLPYAMALDCENEWNTKFESVLSAATMEDKSSSSSWYSGRSWNSGQAGAFASSLSSSLVSSVASASSSSSSGSGGGGFSGGGGGGGGGGGW